MWCILVLGFAQAVSADEVPSRVLSKMGLGGLRKMSDEQGMRVRGQGTASVLGFGFSTLILATQSDSYQASSGPIANALANGSSQTTAQLSLSVLGINVASITAATIGSSHAFAR
jgi:hypothetical protein